MTQVDILLRSLPEEFDIFIGNQHSYDIVINDEEHFHDVHIYNLVDRQGIYGDELDPIILHLSESTVDCFLDISLLENAFLYTYDDRYVNDIDRYPMFVLDHGGGHNYFALNVHPVDVRKTIYAKLYEQAMSITSQVNMALVETVGAEQNNISLSTYGDISNTVSLNTPELSAKLTNQIISNMSNVCELMMNNGGVHWFDGYLYEYDGMLLSDMDAIYPKLSLTTLCGKVYMKFSFELERHNISIGSSVPDFITTSNIKNMVRSVMNLDADASFTYDVFCSCGNIVSSLNESRVNLKVITYLSPDEIMYHLSDKIVRNVYSESSFDASGTGKLGVSMNQDMELHYGFGQYDNQYLYYWDDHTIFDMAAEIVNR